MEILTIMLSLLALILLIFLLSMIWPPNSPWSPFWRTNRKRSRLICKLAKIGNEDVVFDLGSGDGEMIITAVEEFKAKKAVGVEIDPLRVWISKMIVLFKGQGRKIKIVRQNFFDADIKEATVVFMYLVPKALAGLRPKLLKELKPGTRVITFVYKIDLPLIKEDLKNEIYLFKIPK